MRVSLVAMVLGVAGLCAVCFGQPANAPTGEPAAQPAVNRPPKPTVVPLQWEFDIEMEPFRSIFVDVPGANGTERRLFWYLRYTVTNRGESDQMYVPEFVLYTDSGELTRAGNDVPTSVFDSIRKLHNDPLLQTQTAVTRKLLHGEDNAKAGVAIWPDFDPNAGEVDVFIGGLSGETVAMPLPEPVTVEETNWKGERQTVTKTRLILAKTLHLRYAIPGEKAARRRVSPRLLSREWVMR